MEGKERVVGRFLVGLRLQGVSCARAAPQTNYVEGNNCVVAMGSPRRGALVLSMRLSSVMAWLPHRP